MIQVQLKVSIGGTLEKTLSYLASIQILFARAQPYKVSTKRFVGILVYNSIIILIYVHDSHHMYTRSIYNNLSFKF